MMNLGDHIRQLIAAYAQCETHEAESMTWQAAMLVYQEHPWVFCLKESRIVTEGSYGDGTLNLTEGSTAIVLTGGAWDPTWTKRRLIAGGFAEPYDVTILSATTGTLGAPWVRASDPASAYTMFRDTYSMPSDCNFGCEYTILDVNRSRAMKMKDFGVFASQRVRWSGGTSTGTPSWVTRVALDANGQPQVTFGPDAPSAEEVYQLYYFAAPVKPTLYTNFITPLFPANYEHLIWRRARWLFAEEKRKWRERDEYRAIYYEHFFDAAGDLDGGAEVDRRIRGTVPDFAYDYRSELISSAMRGTYQG